jgi:hypothetical protein
MIEFASCLLSGEGAPRIRLETPDPVSQLASIPAAPLLPLSNEEKD